MTGAAAADWLGFAAMPACAVMALLDHALGGGPMAGLCGDGRGAPLGGMAPMYLLMGIVHAAPWLRLVSARA